MDPVPDQSAQPMVPQDQPAQQDLLPAAADALDQALAGEAAAAGYESSDLELSSDDDDDSSASGDNGVEKQDERDMDLDMEGESQVVATRNEITDIVVEMPVFDVTESTPVVAIGRVESILDKTVVIQSDSGVQVLDMGCLLVYADRTIIGEVFETFGPISHPYYSVRYNSKDDIDTTRAISGAQVFYVPSYERSQLVEVEKIRHIKGTDASNLYDEEINESDMEFSDDEEEKAARKRRTQKRKNNASKTAPVQQETRALPVYDDATLPVDPRAAAAAANSSEQSVSDTIDELMNYYSQPRTRPEQAEDSASSGNTTNKSVKSLFSHPPSF